MIILKAILKDEKIREIELSGHGNGLKGRDTICAAVSGISQTALLGILYYNKHGINWKMEDGFLHIDVYDMEDDRIQIILTSMIIGLKAIAKEYPKQIKIEM